MSDLILLVVAAIAAGVAWRFPTARRDMLTGGLFTLPFLALPTLVTRHWSFPFDLAGADSMIEHIVWLFVLGALAGAVYTLLIHRHLTPVIHPRRGLMSWLAIGPVVTIILLLATKFSLLVCATAGLGVELALILVMQWVLVWDTIAAMVGMGLLYLVAYFFFGHLLHVSWPESGIIVAGYPLEDFGRVLAFGALWGPPYAALRALTRGDTPFLARHHTPKQVISVSSITAVILLLTWVNMQFFRAPQVVAASPAADQTISSLVAPVSIQLDRPFDRKSVSLSITPAVEGTLSFDDSYLQRSFVRRLVFTPDSYFVPDTTYTVEVSSLKSLLGQAAGSYRYQFHTPALPAVIESKPASGQKDVIICDPFSVTLNQPVNDLAELVFVLSPATELAVQPSSDQKSFTIQPKECLAQSTAYTLSVQRRLTVHASDGELLAGSDPTEISQIAFTTKGPPGISSSEPQGGGVLTSTKQLTVHFSEPMERSTLGDYFQITPPIAGSWSWQDDQTAVYAINETLPFETRFTISLLQGLHDQKDGFVPADAAFSFTTIGHVQISSVSPYRGSAGVSANASITVTFDQPVDHASAESRFSLSPKTDGSISWQDRSLTYKATLSKDTSYQVTVDAGVHSLVGLDMTNAFTSSFQTEESVTILNVPQYYQQRALSCEVAALKMALNYRGVGVSESDLLNQLPTDSAPRNGGTWADPNQVFVGDVNGHQNTTGYGVHAAPIAALASSYRSAQVTAGWSVQQLAQTIADGNPVVVWGTAGYAKADSWTTGEGKPVSAWVGEHARVAVGFTGKPDNPTHIILNDPIFGRLRWTTAQFRSNWGALWYMGVVIL